LGEFDQRFFGQLEHGDEGHHQDRTALAGVEQLAEFDELSAEKMLADRWVCSVARLQRWRTVGEGPQYLKIVGKVLHRLKDIEAYEEACLIRKVF
jgi:hypothetical protein